MAQMSKCANPDCPNLVTNYAKPLNRHKVQEYCSPECHQALTTAMRDFAAQWYGRRARFGRKDVRAALIQALAVYGGVKRMAGGLVPNRPRSTLYAWMKKLKITQKDVLEFRRQGVAQRQPVGPGRLRVPKWRGAVT